MICKTWRKTDLSCEKWQKFNKVWSQHWKVSQISTSIGSFCTKYLTFDQRRNERVIFHGIQESYKIWRRTNLWFGKWHEAFGKFLPEHWKVSKFGLSIDPFLEGRKCMSLKFTGELCVITMRNDTKVYWSLLVSSNVTWGIWQILTRAIKNFKDLHLKWAAFNQSI